MLSFSRIKINQLALTAIKPRFYYFDALRAMAIVAVILLHNAADQADLYGKIPEATWIPACFYYGLTRFCVPMFVLLSGALLLKRGREITIRELLSKRLPKLVIPLVTWSFIYMVYAYFTNAFGGKLDVLGLLKSFYNGPIVYHFWFLYMLIGIYLVSPIINLFINSAGEIYIKYFLCVWFIANSFFAIIDTAFEFPFGVDFSGFTGYVGYFVLGYYLQNFDFNKRMLTLLYWASILAFIASVAGIILLHTGHAKHAADIIESDFTPEMPFAIAGLFLWMKNYSDNHPSRNGLWARIVTEISKESYGIYIVHVLIVRILLRQAWYNAHILNMDIIYGAPIKVLIIFVLSYLLVRLVRLLPLSGYII